MKLTNILSSLILEHTKGSIPVTKFIYEDELITLDALYHQWNDRQGVKSLEEIIDIYEYNFNNNPKYYDRVGVPNKLIKEIFINNFELIRKSLSKLNLISDNSIVFIKEVGEQFDLPQYMDYAEIIILTDDLKNYKVLTSTFSKNGNFLKTFGKSKNSPRILL